MAYGFIRACASIMLAVLLSVTAACADQKGQVKSECVPDENAIKSLLDKLGAKDFTIIETRRGPIDGLIEVVVVFQTSPSVIYFDCSKKYLIQGRIMEIETKRNPSEIRMQELAEKIQEVLDRQKIDVSQIPLDEAIVLGKKNAAKKVIVFTNPDCPHCVRFHGEMKKVAEKRNDIAFHIKILARPNDSKAQTIVCSKSLKTLEDAYEKKALQKKECGSKELENTGAVAGKFGITGTPTVVLPDGRMRSGSIAADELIQLVDGKK